MTSLLERKTSKLGKRADDALLCLVVGTGLVGLLGVFLLSVDWPRLLRGQVDFLGFFAGAALVGTDGLYSQSANHEVQLRLAGFSTQGTYYIRLPFYAAAMRPLAFLPYQVAYWVFEVLSISAAVLLARFFRGPWQLTMAVALFFPTVASIVGGQDTTLIMAICTAAILLYRMGRDAAAGFVLSLCVVKFHLFFLVPLVLIRRRMWRMLGGAAGGVVTWMGISTLVAGPGWPRQYLAVLASPAITPNAERMPSVQGVLLGSPLVIPVTAVVLVVFVYAAVTLRDFEECIGISLAGGLLLNAHSYVYDCVFLLPALVTAVRGSVTAARRVALFLLTPIPYFLLLLGHGVLYLLSVVALAVLVSLRSRRPLGDPCAAA